MTIKRRIGNLIFGTVNKARVDYYRHLQTKLKNRTPPPTIIASDCFGVFVYHNLDLPFASPTINLFFSKEDFICFVQELPGFLAAELVDAHDDSVHYPVGLLEYGGKTIRVNFMHYETFAEAKRQWDTRKLRVDYQNIFIIQLIATGVTEKDIRDFDALPYQHKLLITSKNLTNSPNVVTHRIFRRKNYTPGRILEYGSRLSIRRYMDAIDYVGFLNAGVDTARPSPSATVAQGPAAGQAP